MSTPNRFRRVLAAALVVFALAPAMASARSTRPKGAFFVPVAGLLHPKLVPERALAPSVPALGDAKDPAYSISFDDGLHIGFATHIYVATDLRLFFRHSGDSGPLVFSGGFEF